MKKLLLIVSLCVLSFSCSGGGGDEGEAPVISNLSLWQDPSIYGVETTVFTVGDTVYVKFDFSDEDADVKFGHCIVENTATQRITHKFDHIDLEDYYAAYFGLDGITKNIGTYRLTVYVTDKSRNKSNTLNIEYSVN